MKTFALLVLTSLCLFAAPPADFDRTVYWVPVSAGPGCAVSPDWMTQGCSTAAPIAWLKVTVTSGVSTFEIKPLGAHAE